jgi:uracil-DNA glycosylase
MGNHLWQSHPKKYPNRIKTRLSIDHEFNTLVAMTGLKSIQLDILGQQLLSCRRCIDAGYEITPGAIFSHPCESKVMLVGQAPGITEVEAQRPFNAGSGKRLFQWLEQAGWREEEFRKNNVMTAVTKCYPGKGKNGNGDRVPTKAEQKFCRPFLEQEISFYKPQLLILVGGLAIKLLYPAKSRLDKLIGTAAFFPISRLQDPLNFDLSQADHIKSFAEIRKQDGRWIVPLPHPSGASLWPNKPKNKILIDRAIEILRLLRRAYHL